MIPATKPVTAYDPATGEQKVYGHWTLENVTVARICEGRMSALITCRRCRKIGDTKTETITDDAATKLGVSATVQMSIADVFTPDGTNYPPSVAAMIGLVQAELVKVVAALMNARGVR